MSIPASQSPPSSATDGGRLSGNLGPVAIIFMVVAAAAPLAVVGGVLPLGALLGNGAGMPSMFLLAGALLGFFAVGVATMSRHVPKPGAFFTYVGYGLGRPSGLAAAWLAMLTYTAMQVAVFAFLGLTLDGWVGAHVGLDLPWWFWAITMVVIVGYLGYRQIELSSKVLGLVLLVEIGIVLLLSVVIVVQGGADGLSSESFHPSVVTSGSPSLGLMFAIAGYAGFEATAVYRDEARDPERTIPRATYGAVAVIALFYAFTSWALVQGWGRGFGETIADTTSNFIVVTADRYLGNLGAEIVNLLLITSLFACALSFHNVTTRYQHAMAKAGVLPPGIGKVHPRHQSPHVSSVVLTAILIGFVVLSALVRLDPYLSVYTWLGGVATVAIVVLMALTSVAVLVFLNRKKIPAGPWQTRIAPSIGLIGLAYITFLLFQNFPMLLGDLDASGEPRVGWLSIGFYALMAAFPLFGVAQAYWLKVKRPNDYEVVIDAISE